MSDGEKEGSCGADSSAKLTRDVRGGFAES